MRNRRGIAWTFVFVSCVIPAPAPLRAQGIDYVRAHYTKYEHEVPMRDGTKLFTAVYVPKDAKEPYPILITRTPYSVAPYGVDRYPGSLGPSELFTKDAYIFAYQDVRGRHMSEGEWIEMTPHRPVKRGPADVDESTDTFDTVEWLIKNVPNNNGRVGMWGVSYPGFYAAAGMIDAHPALKAVSPQAPVADLFMGDDAYHNGAFYLAANFGFYTFFAPRKGGPAPRADSPRFDYGTPDGYDFYMRVGRLVDAGARLLKDPNPYWEANVAHTTYDEFWKSRNILPHLQNVTPAVLTVGGWFDAEDLAGPLKVYAAVEKSNPKASNRLVMGPWTHGSWSGHEGNAVGNLRFASTTGVFYREKIELPFFAHHLKGKGDPKLPEAYVFETGRNEWQTHDTWPPQKARPRDFYLAGGGRISTDRPAEAEAFDEYVSDPGKPVPFLPQVAPSVSGDYMTEDQRFSASRPDVLVYATEPLGSDLTVTGPITVRLQVSTTGTDSDFVVKLIDAYPGNFPDLVDPAKADAPPPKPVRMGGYQQMVRGEPFRAKFRKSFEVPEPLEPGKVTPIEFVMPDVCHTFRKGHRLMVHVQSSWFPLVDRNPQKFMEIPKAAPGDFQKATQRVYRSRVAASSITLLVAP